MVWHMSEVVPMVWLWPVVVVVVCVASVIVAVVVAMVAVVRFVVGAVAAGVHGAMPVAMVLVVVFILMFVRAFVALAVGMGGLALFGARVRATVIASAGFEGGSAHNATYQRYCKCAKELLHSDEFLVVLYYMIHCIQKSLISVKKVSFES